MAKKKELVVDKTMKFVWAYLILHGTPTSGEWSYYGGSWERIGNKYLGWDEMQKEKAELQAKVLKVGIDWSKTTAPEVSTESVFEGTFCSGGYAQATVGDLVLLNGETIKLGSTENEAAVLAETARQMIAKPGESEVEKFAKLLK